MSLDRAYQRSDSFGLVHPYILLPRRASFSTLRVFFGGGTFFSGLFLYIKVGNYKENQSLGLQLVSVRQPFFLARRELTS